jgi:hypothetical protein
MEYFEQNQEEHYCPKEIYEQFIPTKFIETQNIFGWKSLSTK